MSNFINSKLPIAFNGGSVRSFGMCRASRTWSVTAIDVEIADSDGTIDQGPVDG